MQALVCPNTLLDSLGVLSCQRLCWRFGRIPNGCLSKTWQAMPPETDMIGRVAVISIGLIGSPPLHPAGQIVEEYGMLWEKPGDLPYYRAPGLLATQTPSAQATQKTAATAAHDAAHILRSAARDLDNGRKTGDTTSASNRAKEKITEALKLLQ